MDINIGSKIKALRLRENMTQEALAEKLNISFQSVSRWENGMSAPDISLIPVVARFFNVSTDYLFGMYDEELARNKDNFEKLYIQKRCEGDIDGAYAVMTEARRVFPRDIHFCANLAEVMDMFEGGTAAQMTRYAEENFSGQIFTLCKRILDESRDEADRCKAQRMLCNYYAKSGNSAEAVRIAESMADILHSKEILLSEVLYGEEKRRQLHKNIMIMAEYISDTLVKIAFRKEYGFAVKMPIEQKISNVKAAIEIYKTLIPDGNYREYSRTLCWNYRRLAELTTCIGETEKAYGYLLEAEKMAYAYDALETRRMEPGKAYVGSEREMLAYRLDEMKDCFEGHEGFAKLRERLGETNISIE